MQRVFMQLGVRNEKTFRVTFFGGNFHLSVDLQRRDQPAICARNCRSLVGAFESHGDIGKVLHAGSVEYAAAKKSYTIAGSGENMWFGTDAFQFAWKKTSGDATLTTDISFLAAAGTRIARLC